MREGWYSYAEYGFANLGLDNMAIKSKKLQFFKSDGGYGFAVIPIFAIENYTGNAITESGQKAEFKLCGVESQRYYTKNELILLFTEAINIVENYDQLNEENK